MDIRRPIRKSRFSPGKAWFLLLVVACAFAGWAVFWHLGRGMDAEPAASFEVQKSAPFLEAKESGPGGEVRLVYPYSVIPGGVRSREELAAHVASDPVVSGHFSDFNVREARMVRADRNRMLHVSYRKDDVVYWTRNKVRIPEGEEMITDGDCEARGRCGNRVSAVPLGPVSDEEPMVETMDIPQLARLTPPPFPEQPLADLQGDPLLIDLGDPAALPDPGWLLADLPNRNDLPPFAPADPGTPVPGGGGGATSALPSLDPDILVPEIPPGNDPPFAPPDDPGFPVPEPGMRVLLLTGLAAVAAFRLARRR